MRQVNRRGLECLIKVGALDDFGERAQILAALDQLLQASVSSHEAADAGQLTLFMGDDSAAGVDIHLAAGASAKVSKKEILEWEKELVGVYVSSHPLQQMTVDLMNIVTHASVDITEELGKQAVVIAGVLAEVRPYTTKKGDQMAFCRLEDLQGSVDVTVFPQLFKDQHDQWRQDKIVIVWGKAEPRNGRVSVVADRVQDYVQGQRIIEDTSTTYHRYQNGRDSPERPSMHRDRAGNGTVLYAPPSEPAHGADDGGDFTYGEASPFAGQTPDWMGGDEAIDDVEAPVTRQAGVVELAAAPPAPVAEVAAPASPHVDDAAPVPAPGLVALMSPAAEPLAAQHAPRLIVTFRRSHSLDGDRRRLSNLVDLLERYQGKDRFVVIIEAPGQVRYQLDFPNSTTSICKDLKRALSEQLGAQNWRVEP